MLFKKLSIAAFILSTGVAQAFTPQTGTWIINSELDGKPGRGLAIDVQKDTLVMQMYAYERNGEPTFYLATGNISDGQVSTSLMRYAGGRHLGSGPMSGKEAGNAGNIKFRFTSNSTGFVTLPGEPEKEISRFNFAYPFNASSLLGLWSFNTIDAVGNLSSEAYNLNRIFPGTENSDGLAMSLEGSFACENHVRGEFIGSTICIKLNSANVPIRGYLLKYSVNDGQGIRATSSGVKTGDSFVHRFSEKSSLDKNIILKSSKELTNNLEIFKKEIKNLISYGFYE